MDNSTEDLEALFDQIAEQRSAKEKTAESTPAKAETAAPASLGGGAEKKAEGEPYDIFQRVGMLTRNLHDALRELGYDKGIDSAVGALPDARARLNYIANLTGQGVTFMIMSQSINSALSIHPDITDKNRNLQVVFDDDGTLVSLKGMKIITIPEVTFVDPFGNQLPLYADVVTSDSTVWHNYVIFGVGGPDLGYTGIATSGGGADRLAPLMVKKADEFNRRLGVMGYLELVHVIQDWFVMAVLNNVI